MGKVIFDISMSLDGFITGANPRPEAGWGGLGEGGERLHDWGFNSADPRNREIMEEYATAGANIFGRTGYNHSILNWGADGPTGAARIPTVIVSHSVPQDVPDGVSTVSLIALKPPLKQPKNWQAIRMFTQWAQTLPSNSSNAASLTKSRFTSSLCCSAAARDCSRDWTASTFRLKPPK